MTIKMYSYEAPSEAVFEDIKQQSINIWKTYDDTYGYATGKIDRIKDMENISDNAMYIVGMFDWENQVRLLEAVSTEARKYIQDNLSQ